MIDWDKPGTSTSPVTTTASPSATGVPGPTSPVSIPNEPSLTAPVAPVQSAPNPITDAIGQAFAPVEGAQDPFQLLSGLLSGQNDIGDIGQSAAGWAKSLANPISPLTAGVTALSHVPLGWVPGGADDQFEAWGQHFLDTGDTSSYAEWARVKAAGEASKLDGGNLKADFNLNATLAADSKNFDSVVGSNPALFLGSGGFGSAGGALASVFKGFLGEFGIAPNEAVAKLGLQDENGAQYKRLQDILIRYENLTGQGEGGDTAAGMFDSPLTPVEIEVGKGLHDKTISAYHASQLLIREGAGYSSNPLVNIVATMILDPTTWTPVAAGKIAGLTEKGATLIEQGAQAANRLEKAQMAMSTAQQATPRVYQIARATLGADPLGAFAPGKQSAGAQGILDLEAGVAVDAWSRAHGPANVIGSQRVARGLGIEEEFNQAVANAAMHQSRMQRTWAANELALREGKVIEDTPDNVADLLMRNTPESSVDDIVDYNATLKFVPTTEGELDDLAARLATMSGKPKEAARSIINKMNEDERAIWHSVTYDHAYRDLEIAKQGIDPASIKFSLDNIVLMNDNTLDDATRQNIVMRVRAAIKSGDLTEANRLYDDAARRYSTVGQYGFAPGGQSQLTQKVDYLEQLSLPRSLDPDELASVPEIGQVLGRHFNGSRPMYRVGFRPDEEVGWGNMADSVTGELRAARQPLIARRIDAKLPPPKFHDVVRNSLGQVLGDRAAGAVSRPVESMQGLFETSKDIISGRRVYLNWEQRFINNMRAEGVNDVLAKDVFRRIGERVGSRYTTVRAAHLEDAQTVLDEIAAEGRMLLPDGRPMSSRDLLLTLLDASKGDVRVVGLGTSMSQRMRNIIVKKFGDKNNKVGELTVSQYLNFRYRLNITFGLQRALEGPYYAVVYGAADLLRPAVVGKLEDTELILRNLGNTSLGRHFALDATEYAVRSNFGISLTERMAKLAGNQSRWEKAVETLMNISDPSVRNSMVALTHNNIGLAVREVLEDVQAAAKAAGDMDGVPEQLALLTRSWDEFAKEASARAGRTLDENEIGVMYIQELFASARRMKPVEAAAMKAGRNPIDVSGLLHEKTWMEPSSLGELNTIHPDALALEIGADRGIFDAASLRDALRGKYSTKTGEQVNPIDMKWLRTQMEALHMHPDAIARAERYFGGTWQDFWDDLARPVADGGMDISPRAALGAQEVIRQMAVKAGMDPWEFLSSVVGHSVTGRDLKTVMGDFARFLQGNPKGAPLREWIRHFNSVALQESGARALINEFDQALPKLIEEAKAAGDTVAQAKWEQAALGLKGEVGKSTTPGSRPIFGQSPAALGKDIEGVPTPGQMTLDELKAAEEVIPHNLKVVARGAYGEPGYHSVVKTADGTEVISPRTYPTAQEAIDAGHADAQKIATEARKAAGEPTHRPVTSAGRAATRPPVPENPVPEGFTTNPHVAASGQTFPMDIKRDGLFRVSMDADGSLTRGAFRGSNSEFGGIGSAGDVAGAGRVSFLTDYARAQTYESRMRMAVRAARGEITRDEILAEFRPLYEKAYPGEADQIMSNAVGKIAYESATDPKALYDIVRHLDSALTGKNLTSVEKGVNITAKFENVVGIDPEKIGVLRLATRERAEVQKGIDMAELTIKPEDVVPLGRAETAAGDAAADDGLAAAGKAQADDEQAFKDVVGEAYDEWFEKEVIKRIKSGKPHSNDNVEAIARGMADWTRTAVAAAKVQGTRRILKDLTEKLPSDGAAYWNRSEALVHDLMRSKIKQVETDVFRLAEMQTKRSSFGRSINHPIFGFYPASYMWGKVFPETVKFLARNPYGVTYDIAKVHMLIAAEREMNPDFDEMMGNVDRSEGAFMAGYLTPTLPWEGHEMRMAPFGRGIMKGIETGRFDEVAGEIFRSSINSMSPTRWVQSLADTGREIGEGVIDAVTTSEEEKALEDLSTQLPAEPGAGPSASPQSSIDGPVKGTDLGPVLVDSMDDLSKVLAP